MPLDIQFKNLIFSKSNAMFYNDISIFPAKDFTNQMQEQERQLKSEAEQQAIEAQRLYELEKENAVKEAIEKEHRERDLFVENQIKIMVDKLKKEARNEMEKELKKQEEILKVSIASKRRKCCKAKEREREYGLKHDHNQIFSFSFLKQLLIVLVFFFLSPNVIVLLFIFSSQQNLILKPIFHPFLLKLFYGFHRSIC